MNYQQRTETVIMLVTVIQYNLKVKVREFPYNGEVYYPEENEDGFPVYFVPKELARIMLVHHEDRYRLYKSKSISVSYTEPGTGAAGFKKINPWYYQKKTKQVGFDEENNEARYESYFQWYEDPKNYSVKTEKRFSGPSQTPLPVTDPPKKTEPVPDPEPKPEEKKKKNK